MAKEQKTPDPSPSPDLTLIIASMIRSGFIEAALTSIRDALETAADKVGLILRHYAPSRSAASRFRANVTRLETMFRRVLVLMAARIVAEAAKRAANKQEPITPAKAGAPASKMLPPDVLDVTLRMPRRKPFRLVPPLPARAEQIDKLRALPRPKPVGRDCTVFVPLLYRYRTLMRALAEPERQARRMARRLAALKAAGEAKPLVPAEPCRHQYPPDLGVVAALLPDLTRNALTYWFDTG